jgi:hypothetical protein
MTEVDSMQEGIGLCPICGSTLSSGAAGKFCTQCGFSKQELDAALYSGQSTTSAESIRREAADISPSHGPYASRAVIPPAWRGGQLDEDYHAKHPRVYRVAGQLPLADSLSIEKLLYLGLYMANVGVSAWMSYKASAVMAAGEPGSAQSLLLQSSVPGTIAFGFVFFLLLRSVLFGDDRVMKSCFVGCAGVVVVGLMVLLVLGLTLAQALGLSEDAGGLGTVERLSLGFGVAIQVWLISILMRDLGRSQT